MSGEFHCAICKSTEAKQFFFADALATKPTGCDVCRPDLVKKRWVQVPLAKPEE